jgi:hypothetical protein
MTAQEFKEAKLLIIATSLGQAFVTLNEETQGYERRTGIIEFRDDDEDGRCQMRIDESKLRMITSYRGKTVEWRIDTQSIDAIMRKDLIDSFKETYMETYRWLKSE